MTDHSIRPIDHYFLKLPEPAKSCMEVLRKYLQTYHQHITEEWKYGMPFYYYKGKMFCYLWTDKKAGTPYIGIVKSKQINHPLLIQGDRKLMKVLYVGADKDIPVDMITGILDMARGFYS